jgi:hypothetical protein
MTKLNFALARVVLLILCLYLAGLTALAQTSTYNIKPSDLPPPNPAEDATNPPRVIPRPAGAKFNVPAGFSVETFAEGDFTQPRWMALAPNGDV